MEDPALREGEALAPSALKRREDAVYVFFPWPDACPLGEEAPESSPTKRAGDCEEGPSADRAADVGGVDAAKRSRMQWRVPM